MKISKSMEKYHSYFGVIGEGSYSVVYKGVDMTNNKYVAIKKIRMELCGAFPEPKWPRVCIPNRVAREIDILERLQHKNIVSLLETVVEQSRQIYLIFECLGMDLWIYLSQLPPNTFMVPLLVKSYVYQINSALICCQENFIIHCDIKPNNLLISSSNGVIKLADFGSAMSLEVPLERCRRSVVTRWYRPPELLLGASSYSYPIDVWSLGCVFAEMVSKAVLFEGYTKETQLIEIFKVVTTPTEETWPEVASFDNLKKLPKFDRNCLQEKVPQLDECGLDLLRSMLICDPHKRIMAKQIAQHPYFMNVDLTVKPNLDNFVSPQG